MSNWINSLNILIFLNIFIIINNNKNILNFLIFAEVSWILMYILVIILSSVNTNILLLNTLFILICTAIEISLLSLLMLNIFK